MTREEAIRILDPETRRETMKAIPVHNRIDADQEACQLAVVALRAQQELESKLRVLESNEPMTLDELRQMYDGEEGAVWVKNGQACFPAILDIYDGELVAVWSAEPDYFNEKHYGKTWLAYRHKPEEGTV